MEKAEKKQISFVEIVEQELKNAREIYPPFNSLHEAYAVILEEVKEFETEVFRKPHERHPEQIMKELVQVAAMCQRAVEDCLLTSK
ncbi:MAG TPA: hypothetical protein VK892_22310 [Pyrinomonadaceae bacterium]|nr:hypothetical protein [Pyrinomonadaceae bacterium]